MVIITIDIHSFSDVITNSSTDLFVCDTKKTIKMIENILKSAIELQQKTKEFEDSEYENYDRTYDNMFGDVYIVDDTNIDRIIQTLGGYDDDISSEYNIRNELGLDYKWSYQKESEDKLIENNKHNHNVSAICHKKYKERLKRKMPDIRKKYKGKLIIVGRSDDSIPYWMFEFIESNLNGTQFHLG